jgi:hypothetical protein
MRRAIEDRAADRLLQELHAAGERRLARVQPPRGIAELAILDHGEKVAQMSQFQFHVSSARPRTVMAEEIRVPQPLYKGIEPSYWSIYFCNTSESCINAEPLRLSLFIEIA